MHRRSFLGVLAGGSALASRSIPAAHAQQTQPPRLAALRAPTFFGCIAGEIDTFKADAAVIGIPYDLGHGSNPGTRMGPRTIREVSMELLASQTDPNRNPGFYDIDHDEQILAGIRMVDLGNVLAPPAQVEPTLDRITAVIAAILERGAMPVVIGGDHSITFPVLRGYSKAPRKIHIIHLDAHHDYAETTDRATGMVSYRHGNHIRHALNLPFVTGVSMIGLRGIRRGDVAPIEEAKKRGFYVVSAAEAIRVGMEKVAASIPAAESYYLTIDIDVLDPSLAPGTGTPVPGGFTYYQLRDLLAAIAARGPVVGFDLSEVSPPNDVGNITSRLGGYLVMGFLGASFSARRR